MLDQARIEADNLHKESELRVKDELFERRETLNREFDQKAQRRARAGTPARKARRFARRQGTGPARRERDLEQQKKKLPNARSMLEKKLKDAETLVQQQTQKLHEISGLSREQAERACWNGSKRELATRWPTASSRLEEALAAHTCEEKARRILATAIQRYAAEHTADTTVSTVDIPSDDMKGRIIGREGRNIRTFEKATGVDVIVDDTPGVVIVSAFDNIRRETARLALTKLIQDGRIHPSRIEEVVKETQAEMEKHILEVGKQAAPGGQRRPRCTRSCCSCSAG